MSDIRPEACWTESTSRLWPGVKQLEPGARHVFQLPVATMSDGSTLVLSVNVVKGCTEGPTLLAVGGCHGDEHEGPTALIHIWEGIRPESLSGSLVVVPILNPPAFRAARRQAFEDNVDMNRIFPGTAEGSLTHRIARTFVDQVLGEASFVLSMHGWSSGYLVEPYVEFPGWASTSAGAWAGARAFGLGYLNPLDANPGRLMNEATAQGIPLIEVEVGGLGSTQGHWRQLYESGTERLLDHLGMLKGCLHQASAPAASTVERHECLAPVGGLLRPAVEVGEQVHPGQTLGTIYDLNLRRLANVEASSDGIVGVLRLNASVLPGLLVATVFSPISWSSPG